MQRLTDWRARLTSYLLEHGKVAFSYGKQDCALFAAGAVAAMTGHDPAAEWRGRYRTPAGGLRLMRMAGFRGAVDFMNRTFVPIHPAFAGDGDIAAVPLPEGEALGVIVGEVVYLTGPSGVAMQPRTSAERAWVV